MIEKIRNESNQTYKGSIPESYDQLNHLKYTNASIQEAIRLKPTTPILFFQSNEDVVLNDLEIPKDTSIILQNSYASIQEDNFSDATKYDPSRWIKSECPYHQNHNPKTIKAFGGGSRLCPGMHLSMIEMTTAVSAICKQFNISLSVPASEIEENFAFTVYPENLKLKFTKVNTN